MDVLAQKEEDLFLQISLQNVALHQDVENSEHKPAEIDLRLDHFLVFIKAVCKVDVALNVGIVA